MQLTASTSLLLLCLFLCNCHSATTQKPNAENSASVASADNSTIPTNLSQMDCSKPDSTFTSESLNDTSQFILVDKPMAITLFPGDNELEKEKAMDSDAFYAAADDYSYYQSLALDTLAKHRINTVSYSHQKRYIVFGSSAHIICQFDGDKMPNSRGMILYNGKDTPVIWNGTDISGSVHSIFKK